MTCPLCDKDDGNYDFALDCCLVRFALHVPSKTLRAGYLNWWTHKYGQKRMKSVKEQIWAEWEKKRAGK